MNRGHVHCALISAALLAGCATGGARRAPTVDRSTRPTLGTSPALQLPAITDTTLPNGLRLVVVEQHELPIVDAALIVANAGAATDGRSSGLSSLMMQMLLEGAGNRSSQAIAEQVAFLGATVRPQTAWDHVAVNVHAQSVHLDSAFALLSDIVLRPTFPASEFARVQQETITGLAQAEDRGPFVADRVFAQQLFGEGHKYASMMSGDAAGVRALTREGVQRAWRMAAQPQGSTMLIVGDVTPSQALRVTRAAFGAWTAPASSQDNPGSVGQRSIAVRSTAISLVDKPKAPQSSLRVGTVGAPRGTPDYYALEVLNTILGGSFTSRLNTVLRETKGYTYGASSTFDLRATDGPFVIRTEVTGSKTDSSLIEIMREVARIRDTVPSDELAKAKRYLQLQLPGTFETTTSIARQLLPYIVYRQPLRSPERYAAGIEAVTQAELQRVAQRYLDPAKLVITVVGDRASVEPALQALKFGTITVRDRSGAPVPPTP
jgi:zinc protease